MISILEQQTLLLNISRQLKREINTFAIGGTAMMFYNLKDSTKDIDLVFISIDDRKDFITAAKKIGWTNFSAELTYGERKNIPIMLKLVEERLDLFYDEVIDFTFSKEMQKRAGIIRQFEENLIIKVADYHDIILMKCATDRPKDIDDARTIINNREIDWQIIFEEAKNQLSLGNEKALMELGKFIETLKPIVEKDIPDRILDELWELFIKQIKEKQKKLKTN